MIESVPAVPPRHRHREATARWPTVTKAEEFCVVGRFSLRGELAVTTIAAYLRRAVHSAGRLVASAASMCRTPGQPSAYPSARSLL
jgi:hypothetical protein